MPSCIVPHCRNLLQEWIAPFPTDQLLQTRWKHCIEMGTGELLPEVDLLGPSAVVCNMHFMGFNSQGEDVVSIRHPQPTLFFRDDLVLEIESCCLCAQVRIKEELLAKKSSLAKGLTIEEVVSRVFDKPYFDYENGCEYVCEMCTVKVDILLTIHKHFEAGHLMQKTLRHKQKQKGVQFRKNASHAVALPGKPPTVVRGPVKLGSTGKKSVKRRNRNKSVKVDVADPDVSLDPLETVIKVEEATLQVEPDKLSSIATPKPVQNDNPVNKDKPTLGQWRPSMAEEAKRTCYLCNKMFSTANFLLAHLLMIHKDPDEWHCHECKLKFTIPSTCNNHLKLHDIRRPFSCDHCPLRFTSSSMKLVHHTKVHPGLVPSMRSFARQNIIPVTPVSAQKVVVNEIPPLAPIVVKLTKLDHTQSITTPKIPTGEDYSCKTCFKTFESLDILKTHMKIHRSPRPPILQETISDETTDDNMISIPSLISDPTSKPVALEQQPPLQTSPVSSDLSEGKINGVGIANLLGQLDLPPLIPFVTKHHSEQLPHSCKTCFKAFETQESLKTHLKTHWKPQSDKLLNLKRPTRTRKSKPHPNSKFTCSICSKVFSTAATLVKHFNRAHPQLILEHFRCRFCADIYFSRETLEPHSASHRGKYECSRCALEFINPQRLQRHRQMVHKLPSKNALGDCQYCRKTFRRGMILARHVKTHFAGNWTCDICEESFGERYKLVLHMRQHTGNNPLVCYNCNEHFGDPKMLDQHERACAIHTVSSLNCR